MNERDIFDAALAITDSGERAAYLDGVCGDDVDQRSRLQELLDAQQRLGSFLDSPPAGMGATIDQTITEKPGTQVGPYKLLQKLGEGGMGVVYMAEQMEPVERRVALKVIKVGMDTRQVIARFEAERQALAMMDHPNIAKVFDAGTTETGRPYFVMELVKGVPITQYCDEHRLDPHQRLELFQHVCHAVQHAHQKGIIHRDIKSSNVLVAEYDDVAVPKVIDFGVAKATQQRLTEKTMFTEVGTVVGTIEYMSPEQAKLNQLDIDTRSDIYSLGVLLYELLTGEMPFDRRRLRSAAFDEMLRIIRDGALPTIAANRRVDPKRLSALVKGELDWIVMKALEKDRSRRYETATQFASDIQHFISDEPVQACPPSSSYRIRKFARRNRAAISTAVVLAAVLMLGIVATASQARRAIQERDRAMAAEQTAKDNLQLATEAEEKAQLESQRAVQEARNAETQAAIAEAINDFLNDKLLSQADPDHESNRDIKLRTVVDRAAEEVDGEFAEQPLIEAAIRETLGKTYLSLGETESARLQYRNALERVRLALGQDNTRTARNLYLLAEAVNPHKPSPTVTDASRRSAREAEELIREALAIQRRLLGPEHPDTLLQMGNLAISIMNQGRDEEAELLFRELLEIETRVLGPAHRFTLSAKEKLALVLSNQSWRWATAADLQQRDPKRAVKLAEEAIQIHPDSADYLNNLGVALYRNDQFQEAADALKKADAMIKGGDRAHRMFLAMSLWELGREDEAKAMYAQAAAWIDASRANSGQQKRFRQEADELMGLDVADRASLIEHYYTKGFPENASADDWYARGRWSQKRKMHDEAIESYTAAIELDPDKDKSYHWRAVAYNALGQHESALADANRAIEINPKGSGGFGERSKAYLALGELERALADANEAVKLSGASWAYAIRKATYQAMGDHAGAERDAQKLMELEPKNQGHLKSLAGLHMAFEEWKDAVECYDQLLKSDPQNIGHFNIRAMCELISGGSEVYRERCREATDRFVTPEASFQDKRVVADMCCRVADAVDDTGAIVQLAREIVAANPPPAEKNKKILAMALLEDGQTDAARPLLLEIESDSSNKNRGGFLFKLAKAYHALGQTDVAADWLKQGDAWTSQRLAEGNFPYVHFPLVVQIQQREAHEALGIPMPTAEQDMAPKTITPEESTETTAAPSSPALLPHKAGGEGSQSE